MEARDIVVSCRVAPAIKAELQRRADAERRKLADYVRMLLEDHVAGEPPRKPKKS
jgi:hypothetical protein